MLYYILFCTLFTQVFSLDGNIFCFSGPIASTVEFVGTLFGQEPARKHVGLIVNDWIDGYNNLQRPEDAKGRNEQYDRMVSSYE